MFDYVTTRQMYENAPLGSGLIPVEDKKAYAKARKAELVALILAYSNGYKEEELKKKKLVTLERIWETI